MKPGNRHSPRLFPSQGASFASLWGVSHSLGLVRDWHPPLSFCHHLPAVTPPTCCPSLPFHMRHEPTIYLVPFLTLAQVSLLPTILTSPGAWAPQREQQPRKSNPVPPSGLTGTVPLSPRRWHLPFPALFFMNPLIEPQQAFQVGQPHPLTPRGG